MKTKIDHLHPCVVQGIPGLSLVLERGPEEDVFYQMVTAHHIECFDCSISGHTKRQYFFAEDCPEEKILKFLALYDEFGKSLR